MTFLDNLESAISLLMFSISIRSRLLSGSFSSLSPAPLDHLFHPVALPICLCHHFSRCDFKRYRILNLLSIGYAFRPCLRSRLTLRGRALLRNPWGFDGSDSHTPSRYSCQHSLLYIVHFCLRFGFFLYTMLLYHS